MQNKIVFTALPFGHETRFDINQLYYSNSVIGNCSFKKNELADMPVYFI